MATLNYKHLHYFWTVAREGSVTAAAEKLHVSQPAVSTQLGKLEAALGHKLFERSGRALVLTAEGRVVQKYADEIFSLGRELTDTLEGRLEGKALRLVVGLADSIPKLVAYQLLGPAFELEQPARLVVLEDVPERLLGALATQDLDLVLSDMPIPPNLSVQGYNHLLGESAIAIFGRADIAEPLRAGFPASLDGAPFLMPTRGYVLRRSLDDWFTAVGVRPRTVAEMSDSALVRVFGEGGAGLFAAPAIIAHEVCRRFDVVLLGMTDGIRERYFAITGQRRIRHPAVHAITTAARTRLFRGQPE
jgi:LysR family transcriptional regulator, transcriptional activator of nhaA